MSSNLGVMVLLHYPLLQLQVVGDIQEISVIEKPVLELPFGTADGVCQALYTLPYILYRV
jgi:hypothetical protein